MKNIPKEIYLQIGTDRDLVDDFKELEEVTWSEDRINKSDIKFILADVSGSLDSNEFHEWAEKNYPDFHEDLCEIIGAYNDRYVWLK